MDSSVETLEIKPQDHICRYCKRSWISEEGRVMRTAFMLRSSEEFLSVNWLEYFRFYDRKKEMQRIRDALQKKLRIGVDAKIAVLQTGKMVDYVYNRSQDHRKLSVKHKPEENDPSHSGIFGLKDEHDLFIAELIAEVIQETYPAKE